MLVVFIQNITDLSHQVVQVFLRREATQGIDDGADLSKDRTDDRKWADKIS